MNDDIVSAKRRNQIKVRNRNSSSSYGANHDIGWVEKQGSIKPIGRKRRNRSTERKLVFSGDFDKTTVSIESFCLR